MTSEILRLERELHAITDLTATGSDKRLLHIVQRLSTIRNAAALGVLLGRIDDHVQDIQDMIMDAVERFPYQMYCTALARELLPLHRRAPYRTSILIMGLIQSKPHLECFIGQLVGAGPEIQTALREVLQRVLGERPELKPQASIILDSVTNRRTLRASSGRTTRAIRRIPKRRV